jgi:hypothetical protein
MQYGVYVLCGLLMHLLTVTNLMSLVCGTVTNNIGFWLVLLALLTLYFAISLNHNQL